MTATVSLLTDFGYADVFVGVMKGVLLRIAPEATLVDLTHGIPAQDVRAAGRQLAAAWSWFPGGTVHLAVVDPGVGSQRRILAAEHRGQRFVLPDNGLLDLALAGAQPDRVVAVEREDLWLQPASRTFHGRDRFAPTAAHLAAGLPLAELGPAIEDYRRLAQPQPRRTTAGWQGELIGFDTFGNAQSNLTAALLEAETTVVQIGDEGPVLPLVTHYAAVADGEALALVDSQGCIEVAVNGGDARRRFDLRVGDPVRLLRP